MITLDIEQGSEEWMSARAGIPTSSSFGLIVTTKGKPSKQRQKYLYTLAGERITGKKEETYQNAAMSRGIEMEAEARSLYEIINDVKVDQVGICYPDEKKLCASSPDGIVGTEGLVEIKCPMLSTIVSYHINDGFVENYYQQLQGQLLVTGRKWVDVMAYYPAMPPIILRVKRDDWFLETLKSELESFCAELEDITNKLKRRV